MNYSANDMLHEEELAYMKDLVDCEYFSAYENLNQRRFRRSREKKWPIAVISSHEGMRHGLRLRSLENRSDAVLCSKKSGQSERYRFTCFVRNGISQRKFFFQSVIVTKIFKTFLVILPVVAYATMFVDDRVSAGVILLIARVNIIG